MTDMPGHGLLIRRRDVLLLIPGALLLPRFARRLHAADGNWPAFRGASASGVQDGFTLPTQWNADPQTGPTAGVRWKGSFACTTYDHESTAGCRLCAVELATGGTIVPPQWSFQC